MLESETQTNDIEYLELGENAEGIIGQTIASRPRLDEFTKRVSSGEFHRTTDIALPCACIDGRLGCWSRPNAAGGTMSLAVADDLLTQRYNVDGTTASMVEHVFRTLRQNGHIVGDHTDDHAHGDRSGCGANDTLPTIYDFIGRKAEVLRTYAEKIGIDVDDETHDAITSGAKRRTQFSTGREVLDRMIENASDKAIDTLHGDHNEVLAVINKRPGTTIDRDAIASEFGPEYEAFNVDVWSFEAAARALYPDADEYSVQQTVGALTYYNLATALTLCGPTMRVVVLN